MQRLLRNFSLPLMTQIRDLCLRFQLVLINIESLDYFPFSGFMCIHLEFTEVVQGYSSREYYLALLESCKTGLIMGIE